MAKTAVTRYEVTTGYDFDRPIRIAHVSDLHERRCDDILELIQKERPDIICITGDTLERYDNRPQYDDERNPVKRLIIILIHFVNRILSKFLPKSSKPDLRNAHRFLSGAAEIAPVYMSLGNHEQKLLYGDYRFLREHGINLLDNADTACTMGGLELLIGGMSSRDYEDWLEGYVRKRGFKLLLCHHPERFEKYIKDTDVALTLAGHTHGGQIRVGRRGRGFFVPGQGLFGRYAHGCFFDGRLIVSAGCSNTAAFPRLFNPRELVVVTLR